MAHVSPRKKELVEKLVKEFGQSQVIGIVNIHGIPAAQFQKMRRKLRGKVNLRVTKSNLLAIALEQAATQKAGIDKLKTAISGQSAVVTANINPFRLFKEMESTKTKAPAKGGDVAPDDIWIHEGETPFKPGPVVGDLQKAGIPAAIEKGKVVIKKEKLLVPKGEKIPRLTAQALTRLEIFPMTVGLDLRGAYEDGMFYGRDVLAIDEAKVMADFQTAGLRAFNLSVNIGYPTKSTIRPMLGKAHTDALNLAVNAGILTKQSLPLILAKAKASMLALASLASVDVSAEKKSVPSGQPPEAKPEGGKVEKKKGKKEEKKGTGDAASEPGPG
jgi:large subunit ribosomal protein L10